MKRIFMLALFVMASALLPAQQPPLAGQTFDFYPSGCGYANAPVQQCVLDIKESKSPLGIYAYEEFNLNGDGTGLTNWANQPVAPLGDADALWSCTAIGTFFSGPNILRACTEMTVSFSGSYRPYYYTGQFSGVAFLNLTYKPQFTRYGLKWLREINGVFKVNTPGVQ